MSKLAGVAAAWLMVGAAMAAQPPVPQISEASQVSESGGVDRPVFRSTASMVTLTVTVTDGRRLVTGLDAADFQILEDGVPQQVRFFESTRVPMDVFLLLDTSSSMRERMPAVHEAAKGFMRILRDGDRGAVVAFSDRVNVLQGLTSDTTAIESAISSTVASGATALNTAVYVALRSFGRSTNTTGEVRRQAIALLSDGEDTASSVAFDDVLALARKMGVSIYTIGLQAQSEMLQTAAGVTTPSGYALKALSRETGALSFFPANVHELKTAYADIAEELRAQYSIAYAPINTKSDGRFRRIAVYVPTHPTLRPRARAGYVAERPPASLRALQRR